MSVHRAGSYYGVPHSTLEYKVKERNLLRQKKKESAKNLVDSEDTDKQRKSLSPKKSGSPRKRKQEDSTNSGQVSPLSKEILEYLQERKDGSPDSGNLFNGNSTSNSPAPNPAHQLLFGHPGAAAFFGNPRSADQQAFFASDMMRRLQAEASGSSGHVIPPEAKCATQ